MVFSFFIIIIINCIHFVGNSYLVLSNNQLWGIINVILCLQGTILLAIICSRIILAPASPDLRCPSQALGSLVHRISLCQAPTYHRNFPIHRLVQTVIIQVHCTWNRSKCEIDENSMPYGRNCLCCSYYRSRCEVDESFMLYSHCKIVHLFLRNKT